MKKFTAALTLLCLVGLLSSTRCNNSTEPVSTLEFSEMEIHYYISGGWIHTSVLNIYGSGHVYAYQIQHAASDTLKSASNVLNGSEQKEIAQLFESFSSYKSHYDPEYYWTDQNYHTIIFIYSGEADTVSIYMPGAADLPKGLRNILNKLDYIWDEMLE